MWLEKVTSSLSNLVGPAFLGSRKNNTNTHEYGMAQITPGQGLGKAYFGFLEYELIQDL